jgi:hypothetical protein
MSEEKKIEISTSRGANDPKAKMLAALAKKQRGHNTGKSSGPTGRAKVRAGQIVGAKPKMHRRKAGSA